MGKRIYSTDYETEEDRLRKKQSDCHHPFYIKRCSLCQLILDSDHIHEDTHPEEITIT